MEEMVRVLDIDENGNWVEKLVPASSFEAEEEWVLPSPATENWR